MNIQSLFKGHAGKQPQTVQEASQEVLNRTAHTAYKQGQNKQYNNQTDCILQQREIEIRADETNLEQKITKVLKENTPQMFCTTEDLIK